MNNIYLTSFNDANFNNTKLKTVGFLSVMLSVCLLATGCSTSNKVKNTPPPRAPQPVVISQLDGPSLTYLSGAIKLEGNRNVTAEQWMTIADSNYKAKKYARSLRAATEALSIDDQRLDARQLAMLSAVKVTESNIDSYHDNALMDSDNKSELKKTLADITTLINTSD